MQQLINEAVVTYDYQGIQFESRAFSLFRKEDTMMYMYENKCIPTIKATKVELDGNDVKITLPDITLLNGKKWHLLICQSIPKGPAIGEIKFVVGATELPAVNGIGNVLRTDALRCRKRYTLIYGWDAPHMMVCGTRPSAYVPSTAVTAAVAKAKEVK